jgi:AcrR family transcriptional regulator
MVRPPAFRRLPRAVREQQVLDAAVAVFSRRGYHATTVDEIAAAARLSKPMVYAYLGTKEELFIACLHREGTRLIEAVAAAAVDAGAGHRGPDPAGQLSRGLHAFLGFVAAHRDGWSVLVRQARGQPPFAEVLGQLRARFAEILMGTLARAAPSLRDFDLTIVGYAMVGATEAVADWLVDHPGADPASAATRLMTALWLGADSTVHGRSWPDPSR